MFHDQKHFLPQLSLLGGACAKTATESNLDYPMHVLKSLRFRTFLSQAMPAFLLGTLSALTLVSATPAHAGLDASFLGTVAGAGGTTIYNYNLIFSPRYRAALTRW